MDVRTEIIREFEKALLAKDSCTPEFAARLCDLIRAGNGMSQKELVSLVESESHDKH